MKTRRILIVSVFLILPACATSSSSVSSTQTTRYDTLAVINARTGVIDNNYPSTDVAPDVAVSDGYGGWYIGGGFSNVQGEARSRLAHLRSDGNLDQSFTPSVPGTSFVNALVRNNRILYGAGNFGVIAIDLTTGKRLWRTNTDSQLNSLAFRNGVLYVGGGFERIGGVSRKGIAALDPRTGKVKAWKVHLSLSSDSPVAIGPLAVGSGAVYFSGDFDHVNGASRPFGIAAVSVRTGRPTTWSPKPGKGLHGRPDDANSILVTHGQVLVGGGGGFVVYDARSAQLLLWRAKINGSADKFTVSGDTVYLGAERSTGGGFDRAGGKRENNLAAVRLPKGIITSWRPNLGRYTDVLAIAASGNNILVAGVFSETNPNS